MLKFFSHDLFAIGVMLRTTISRKFDNPNERIPKRDTEMLLESFKTFEVCFLEAGLESAADQINRMGRVISRGSTHAEFQKMCVELENRIKDELNRTLCLCLRREKVMYFDGRDLFGPEVTEKLPSAILDIEEAGKCFALGRNTACVMHLMRVIEIGLKAVAKGLGVQQTKLLPTWQAVINKIKSEMKVASNKRGADWLKIEPFYREIPAHLFAIKTAWRNPSMHVQPSYDEERALDIYNAVCGFMRYIATGLSE